MVWPPDGLETLSPWGMPLLNTVVLLTSGATVTWAHHAIVAGARSAIIGLFQCVSCIFYCPTRVWYINAPFGISDSVYGSTFFLATGFHGLHVFVELCLTVSFRLTFNHFTRASFRI